MIVDFRRKLKKKPLRGKTSACIDMNVTVTYVNNIFMVHIHLKSNFIRFLLTANQCNDSHFILYDHFFKCAPQKKIVYTKCTMHKNQHLKGQ